MVFPMSYILSEEKPELKQLLSDGLTDAVQILKKYLPKYESGDVYPAAYHDGAYVPVKNADPSNYMWKEGFWPGQLWLAYEVTGDSAFRNLAEKNVKDFYRRVYENN